MKLELGEWLSEESACRSGVGTQAWFSRMYLQQGIVTQTCNPNTYMAKCDIENVKSMREHRPACLVYARWELRTNPLVAPCTLAPPYTYTHGHIYMCSHNVHIQKEIMTPKLEANRVRRHLLKQSDLCVISSENDLGMSLPFKTLTEQERETDGLETIHICKVVLLKHSNKSI